MATPGRAPLPNAAAVPPTPGLLLAMLQVSSHVSDLIFSPGSHPHVEVSGQLVPVKMPGVSALSPGDTLRIAQELIGDNQQATATLQKQGSCDISYSLPGTARFRVNIFVQRGTHAIVMRVIPKSIPSFDELKLPAELGHIASIKNGIVLVTGPTGSGKSSTLAAILDRINETKAYHILTIEDPVEFMHRNNRYIVSQRLLPCKGGTGRVAAIEILKSTLRTREYLDKGEVEGKSLLDAMRDGDTEGMQHFDGEIEKLIRAGMIDYDTAMAYATNPGNLRLQLSDLLGEAPEPKPVKAPAPAKGKQETEIELE